MVAADGVLLGDVRDRARLIKWTAIEPVGVLSTADYRWRYGCFCFKVNTHFIDHIKRYAPICSYI